MRSDWQEYKLSEIINLIGGGTPKRANPEYWNGNIPWLSVKDFNNNERFVSDSEEYISDLGLNNSSAKLLNEKSLIISARGTVGALAQLSKPMAFNQSCYGIEAKRKFTNNDFLYYLLLSSINKVKQNSHGAVFDTITRTTFESINILLPSIKEQKKISNLLGSFDNKIHNNLHKLKTLESIAQTVFKSWFVSFDPVKEKMAGKIPEGMDKEIAALFPNNLTESDLGLIPEKWEIITLKDVVDIHDSKRVPLSKSERSKRPGNYPYYGATSIMDYIDDYIFDGTFLLIGEDGSVVKENGTPFLQYISGKFWVNNHAHVITGKDNISTSMLYLFFSNTNVQPFITGAVQKKLNQQNLKNIPFIKAPNELLSKFNALIDPIFKNIILLKEQQKSLSEIRDLLLNRLISGKIQINN